MNWKEKEKIVVVIILEFSVFNLLAGLVGGWRQSQLLTTVAQNIASPGRSVSLCGRSSLEHLIFSRCRSCSASCSWIHNPPFCLSRAARIARHKLGWHLYSAQFMLLCILKRSNCGVSGCDCSPFITIQTRRVHETTSKEFPLHYVRNWFLDFDTQKSRLAQALLRLGWCLPTTTTKERKKSKRICSIFDKVHQFMSDRTYLIIVLFTNNFRRLAFGNIGDWLGLCAYG